MLERLTAFGGICFLMNLIGVIDRDEPVLFVDRSPTMLAISRSDMAKKAMSFSKIKENEHASITNKVINLLSTDKATPYLSSLTPR